MKLTVTRNHGWYGRLRSVRLMADSVEVGRLRSGQTLEVDVPPEATALYAKMDWGRSKSVPLERLTDGQNLYLNAWFTFNPLRNAGIAPIPIALEDAPR